MRVMRSLAEDQCLETRGTKNLRTYRVYRIMSDVVVLSLSDFGTGWSVRASIKLHT
jgi:hypothetical protein